jgi:phosphoribosylformylglycinamidine synthase subunit PurQ / glutaminase
MKDYAWVPSFPGTNCEVETQNWIRKNLVLDVLSSPLFNHDNSLIFPKIIIIPGGFSYGDYLRAGAMAAKSGFINLVRECVKAEIPVLGICNGFQILCEAKILPGVLLPNLCKKHVHKKVELNLESCSFNQNNTKNYSQCIWIPKPNSKLNLLNEPNNFELIVSCGMGRYYFNESEAIHPVLTYKENEYQENELGSKENIAGITNEQGNVLGLMPHPERSSDLVLGDNSGLFFLAALAENKHLEVKKQSSLENYIHSLKPNSHT